MAGTGTHISTKIGCKSKDIEYLDKANIYIKGMVERRKER
jgi:hypothetical protein